MSGFKNSTRTKIGHDFPSDRGFSGSAGRVIVKTHSRSKPMCDGGKYAGGGLVGHHENPHKFSENMDWSDYKKGGRVKKTAKAAPTGSAGAGVAGRGRPFKKGGPVHSDEAMDKKLIKKELDKRIGHCPD